MPSVALVRQFIEKDGTLRSLLSSDQSFMMLELIQRWSGVRPVPKVSAISFTLIARVYLDLQTVNISLRVLFRPDSTKLDEIYRYIGQDYDARVLPSVVNEVLKATVARYDASQLTTQRDQVSMKIRASLNERLKDFYIVLDDVSITELAFGQEFSRAIEEKQIAMQEAERAKYIVEQAEQDKLSEIARA